MNDQPLLIVSDGVQLTSADHRAIALLMHDTTVDRLPSGAAWAHSVGEPEHRENKVRALRGKGPRGTILRSRERVGKNDPCLCGSGKEFKVC